MPPKCPKCDSDNTPDSKFCKECGTQLKPTTEIPEVTKTLETPVQKLKRGTVFAERYEIIEELGIGGMGLACFHQAIAEDPNFALLLCGRGTGYTIASSQCAEIFFRYAKRSQVRRIIEKVGILSRLPESTANPQRRSSYP